MTVGDYNTLNPIYNITVQVFNSTNESNGVYYTDIDGNLLLALNDTYYMFKLSDIKYVSSIFSENISNDTVLNYYLIPVSLNGIVRLTYDDLTGLDHKICLYYAENNRLFGCFTQNDTIQILINHQYNVVLRITQMDIISSPEGLKNYSRFYYYAIIIGLIMLMIAFVIIASIILMLKALK